MVGVELSFGVPMLGLAVLGGTATWIYHAESKVKKAKKLAEERHEAIERAEASRLRLVQEMQVLQDKATDLVSG
jgi:hypothetical protein